MTRKTTVQDEETFTTGGREYVASAAYVASFLAFLGLHGTLHGTSTFEVELVASGLDEAEERLLI